VLAASGDVVKLACPPINVSVASVSDAFFKTTVPVGSVGLDSVEGGGDTVTVNVTGCPGAEGFADEVKLGKLMALLICTESTFEVLDKKFASPL
jgi:hypothetical protein